jgi:hypothetical protein
MFRAFVGFGVMLLLFPIPGYVAGRIQQVQVTRMKMVFLRRFYQEGTHRLFLQSRQMRESKPLLKVSICQSCQKRLDRRLLHQL